MFERHMDGFTWAKKLSGEVKYKMARGMTAEEIRTMPQIAWPVLRIEFDCTCIEFDCTFEIRA